MSEKRHSEGLEQVYSAKTDTELTRAYASWSGEYDRETAASGYCLPFLIAAWVARYVPRDAGPLLDAGCGTGLSGPYLKALGYQSIEGLDFSTEMLAIASTRNAYGELTQAALGGPLPWADGHFAAFFSTGVFTEGHAPASSLDELARITRAGGHAVFTVRDVVLERGGFLAKFSELETAGRWRLLEESQPFRAFAIDEPDVLVKVFVFEVL
jgi:predicted TPR repeat methyltransferase